MKHLISLPKRFSLQMVWHLTMKECPCHVNGPHVMLIVTHASKANNWTNNNIQQSCHWLQSQFLTTHNILNGIMPLWAWCSSLSVPHYISHVHASIWSIMWTLSPQIRIELKAVLLKLGFISHTKPAPDRQTLLLLLHLCSVCYDTIKSAVCCLLRLASWWSSISL